MVRNAGPRIERVSYYTREAESRKQEAKKMRTFSFWLLASGFWYTIVLKHPHQLAGRY